MIRGQVLNIAEKAILEKKILKITYKHVDDTIANNVKIAPFDLGTSNLKTFEKNKNKFYFFSYSHFDEKTNHLKPMVISISVENIVKLEETDELFDPRDVTNINRINTGYDYRICKWAILPNRNWY